jgi:hypothetical protein
MRHLLLGGLLAALVVAALGLWLQGRERPGFAPVPAHVALPEPDAAPRDAAAVAAPPPSEAVEPAPAPAAAELAPSPPRLDVRPGAKRLAPVQSRVSAAPPEDPYPSLDQLLQLPAPAPAGPQSIDWAGERETQPAPGDPRGPRRLRLDYSRENLVEGVPMQPERRRTDVGVSVRVDESDRLRVRGGVRVEQRERSEEEREADETPTVGVEVRF